MELTFSELRAKEVVNTQDGRKLGRVCDVALCYPEGRWIGLVVPSGKGWGKKQELFLELRHIVKIGEDVILVNVGYPRAQKNDKRNPGMPISPPQGGYYGGGNGTNMPSGRNFEEYE
jgi:YlmC/YmxH family sporulation protein